MRYGILSDVHGNLEALQTALEFLSEQGVERYAFLGDAVGYGPNPEEVCDILRTKMDVAITGNHDAALTGRMDYAEYYDAARHALDWGKTQLSEANHRWLYELPYKIREDMVEFSHGAPVAPEIFDYLFTPEQVEDLIPYVDQLADVTFIGHSHLTIAFRIRGGRVTPIIAANIHCQPGDKYIITAGSVGQPRDRDPRTCCGIFDSESRRFTFHRLHYDVEAVRQRIIDVGLAPVFGERLLVGM